ATQNALQSAAARPQPAVEQTRVSVPRNTIKTALIVGNGSYENATPLDNPLNDAALMQQTLSSIGFETQTRTDVPLGSSKAVFQNYIRTTRNADVSLIYYAGHAVQIRGENYLVPVDFDPSAAVDGGFLEQMVKVDDLVEMIEVSGAKKTILILDSCRVNPFAGEEGGIATSIRSGLAAPSRIRDNDAEILFLYATAPGQVALDGIGRNSPFTRALANWITSDQLVFGDVVRATIREVSSETNGAQVPWSSSNFASPVRLAPAKKSAPVLQSRAARELAGTGDLTLSPDIWNLIDDTAKDSRKQANWNQVEDIRYIAVSLEGDRANVSTCHEFDTHRCNLDAMAEASVRNCERRGGDCALFASMRNGDLAQHWQGTVARPKGSRTSGTVIAIRLLWDELGTVTGEIDASSDGLGEMTLDIASNGSSCVGAYKFGSGGAGGVFNGTCTNGMNFSGRFDRTSPSSFQVNGVDSLGRVFVGEFAPSA
ncbi:MAG: caspase family protein, partial [Pseudomonadota bacterium]